MSTEKKQPRTGYNSNGRCNRCHEYPGTEGCSQCTPHLLKKANRLSAREHILTGCEKTETCWNWIGRRNRQGYGRFPLYDEALKSWKSMFAHRVSYMEFVGPIEEGMVIDHLCNNTSCVNPDHLEVVTPSENSKRAWQRRDTTRCKNGHEKTEENTYHWRGRRICRQCSRERLARREAEQRKQRQEKRNGA